MVKTKSSTFLRKKLKARSTNQKLIIALGLVVAVTASFGIYSQYSVSHAAGGWTNLGTYGWYNGPSQTPYNTATVYACTVRSTGTSNWYVRASYNLKSGKGGSPRWYVTMFNRTTATLTSALVPNIAPANAVRFTMDVNPKLNNYLTFGWSNVSPNSNNRAMVTGIRPSNLAICQ